MKHLCIIPTIVAVVLSMLVLQSCNNLASTVVDKAISKMENYDSTGFVTRSYDLTGFNEIDCNGYVIINYTQGDEYKVEANGKPEILDSYTIIVKKGKMRIDTDKKKLNSPLILNFTAPMLKEVEIHGACFLHAESINLDKDFEISCSGAAGIKIDDLYCEDLDIHISGASKLEGTIHAKKDIDIKNTGASNIKANLYCEDLDINCSGASNCNLQVFCDKLDINCSGAGNIIVQGKANKQKTKSNGTAKIDLSGLTTNK